MSSKPMLRTGDMVAWPSILIRGWWSVWGRYRIAGGIPRGARRYYFVNLVGWIKELGEGFLTLPFLLLLLIALVGFCCRKRLNAKIGQSSSAPSGNINRTTLFMEKAEL